VLTRVILDDLNARYAYALDSGKLDLWPEFFTDDCVYKIISNENFGLGYPVAAIYCDGIGMVRDRVVAIMQTAVYEPRTYRHFVGTAHITGQEEGGVTSEANFALYESIAEREPRILFVGRYVDRVVMADGAPRLRQRLVVYDNYRVFNSLIFPI